MTTNRRTPIAIVSLAGIFPEAPTLDEFWANIVARKAAAREVPAGRWVVSPSRVVNEQPELGSAASSIACYIEDAWFDTSGLKLKTEQSARLDPSFRLVLRTGLDAWAKARTGGLDPSRVGVSLAAIALPTDSLSSIRRETWARPFLRKAFDARIPIPAPFSGTTDRRNRHVTGLPAALLANELGVTGGAFTLDAACASSLYALRLACDDLWENRSDAMLAGGVSRPECLYTQMGFTQLRALSPSGRCAPFDAAADGLVVGEGAGFVVLKRLPDALKAGDAILGVIRAIGLSNDTEGSLLSPESGGQLRAMREAYRQADWRPTDVDYIECHGTGTPLGDPVEVASYRQLWTEDAAGWRPGQCPMGSVKANVGHLLTAAGMAGLGAVLKAMENGLLPPTTHFQTAAPACRFGESPVRVLHESEPWIGRDSNTPRRAAISAFGFGGINAHLLIEEWFGQTETAPSGGGAFGVTPSGVSQSQDDARLSGETPEGVTPNLTPLAVSSEDPGPAIAIVGMGIRCGAAQSLTEFQEAVFQGRSLASGADNAPGKLAIETGKYRIPPNELPEILPQQLLILEAVDEALASARLPRREFRPRAGVVVGIEIDPNTANYHLRWQCEEHAAEWAVALGLDPGGNQAAEWVARLCEAAHPPLNAARVVGALGNIVASRIAKECQFGAASYAVSEGPASGLRALDIAARALLRGDMDMAVAGAVDFPDTAFASDGAGAAAVAVVLKRLEDARRDGDRVFAVLDGDGFIDAAKAGERLRPSPPDGGRAAALVELAIGRGIGQTSEENVDEAGVLAAAAEIAQAMSPVRVAIGDVTDAAGATGAAAGLLSVAVAALALYHEILPPCPAGGIAAKVFAPFADRAFAPQSAQYWFQDRSAGPRKAAVLAADSAGTARTVVLRAAPVEPATICGAEFETRGQLGQETRQGETFGVTPSGVSQASTGTRLNGEPPEGGTPNLRRSNGQDCTTQIQALDFSAERRQPLGSRQRALFAIGGTDSRSLVESLGDLRSIIGACDGGAIERAARRWWAEFPLDPDAPLAVGLVASTPGHLEALICEAEAALRQPDAGRTDGRSGLFLSSRPLGRAAPLAFVFPGSGNDYIGMGRRVAVEWPELPRRLDAENAHLRTQMVPEWFVPERLDWPAGWQAEAARAAAADSRVLICGHVTHASLMADLLGHLGLQPSAVLSYSLGESSSYIAMRAWRDRDAMLGRMLTSPLFETELAGECRAARRAWNLPADEAVEWSVAVIDRPRDAVRKVISEMERVYLLITNAPDECVIGGQRQAVAEAVRRLGCNAAWLEGITIAHCPVVAPLADAYRDLHLFETNPPPGIRFYSSAAETPLDLTAANAAASIAAHAVHGFNFPATIENAYSDGVRAFVEVGPGASCTRMIGKILAGREHFARTACQSGEDDLLTVLNLMASLVAERLTSDLSPLYGTETRAVGHRDPQPARGRMVPIPIGGWPADPPAIPSQESISEQQSGLQPPTPNPSFASLSDGGVIAEMARIQTDLTAALTENLRLTNEAHEAFLRASAVATETVAAGLELQSRLLAAIRGAGSVHDASPYSPATATALGWAESDPPRSLDYDQCLEFARGSVGRVLGPRFAAIDSHPTRVRLPDLPLMLVHRIVEIEGEPLRLGPGRVVTEHDVTPDAWYLDAGRAPVCISVEAGQADLFLSGFLGIDFETRGRRVYRLLDAVVTFHRGLPRPGETIRYDIRIRQFVQQGDTWLFFFEFDGTVAGQPLLTMRDGCAGFFTYEEVDNSGGIILTADDVAPATGKLPDDWREPVPMVREAYSASQVEALRHGDLAGCFGPAFADLPLRHPPNLPGDLMRLVHRVVELDPRGGRHGIGLIRAEADIHPDDWFLTCHFVDDMVMPGTLMYECCSHTLRIFLMRLGWVGEADEIAFESVTGQPASLKCRGPVLATTKVVTYEIEIRELGFSPDAYAIADALMYADGRRIVRFTGMSLKITGLDRAKVDALWLKRGSAKEGLAAASSAPSPAPIGGLPVPTGPMPAVFGYDRMLHFVQGNPSEAFGAPYKPFDQGRILARLPRPPYLLMHRVTAIHDCQPFVLEAGAWVESQFDVSPDDWYFRANRQASMPFAVLLEIVLQPCGWMAAYQGAALRSAEDLKFRNLGGDGILHREVFADSGTLTVRSRLKKMSEAGGMILVGYEVQLWDRAGILYECETEFGFFTAGALATQVGIRGADGRAWRPSSDYLADARRIALPTAHPITPDDPVTDSAPPSALPAGALRMLDDIPVYLPKGGPAALGYLQGNKPVVPGEWFFVAHFYQDPVCPGSLGLEGFIQLLKTAALERWGTKLGATHRFEAIATGQRHRWIYRGQIVESNKMVEVDAAISCVEGGDRPLLAGNGFLRADGLAIYEMRDFAIRMVPES